MVSQGWDLKYVYSLNKNLIVNIFNDGEKLIIKKEFIYSEGDEKKLDTFIH